MKRLFAMFAVFAMAATLAAYVALAPAAPMARPGILRTVLSPLDEAAAQLVALLGYNTAILGLIGLGLVASILTALAVGTTRRVRREGEEDEAEPGPVWRPDPLSDDRITSLRRRLETAEEDEATAAAQQIGSATPVILLRKPRERNREWFGDASWLGGLPRLGEASWPRDEAGTPLPFVAQIDLGEIAAACPQSQLPHSGSLAFFLGSGAVVAVSSEAEEFSEPPYDLPPAFEEGGQPFPPQTTRLSRHFFPFWPVEPITLAVPDDLSERAGPDREAAIQRALAARLPELGSARQRSFRADEGTEAAGPALWWHSVRHLADCINEALDHADRPIVERRKALALSQQHASDLLADPVADIDKVDAAQAAVHDEEVELTRLERQREALPQMAHALDGFVADRPPWEPLSAEESALVGEILAEVNANYGELVQGYAPASLEELATISLRAMISGPSDAFAQVPEHVLDRINRRHRLALRAQHRLLGPDAGGGSGAILLLQLGADDLMEWRWDDDKVFRFRISPSDAEAGNWAAATLSFEDI